jgi:hypothetical protein
MPFGAGFATVKCRTAALFAGLFEPNRAAERPQM